MLRSARNHLRELLEVCATMPPSPDQQTTERYRTALQEAWFRVMPADSSEENEGFNKLGLIAGDMLKRRSDLLALSDAQKIDTILKPFIKKLSKPPFVLFTEENQSGTYAFSHQSLREFVLAWSVYQEVIDKADNYRLLKSSPSFDYEGGEFHARVHDLLTHNYAAAPDSIQRSAPPGSLAGALQLARDIIERLNALRSSAGGLTRDEWNHLVRNLFEMLGELLPDSDELTVSAANVALEYLLPEQKETS